MGKDKLIYTMDNFPFDKLRLGTGDSGTHASTFGTVHQKTYIEIEKGIFEDYEIDFDPIMSPSVSYYIPESGGDDRDPKFYLHPQLFPQWGDKDPETGAISKKKNPIGIKYEEFSKKFQETLNALVPNLQKHEINQIIGASVLTTFKDSYIDDIVKHPLYDAKDKLRGNTANEDKSKTFSLSLWTKNVAKNPDNRNSKKSNNKRTNDGEKKIDDSDGDGSMKVPNTDVVIFTSFYLNNNKSAEKAYANVRKYFYSSKNYENANTDQYDTIIVPRILAPSILWKPKDGKRGVVQFTASRIVIKGQKKRNFSRELDEETVKKNNEKAEDAMAMFGFVNKEDEEEEEEEERGSNPSKKIKTNDGKAIEPVTDPGNAKMSDETNDDEYDHEAYEEAFEAGLEALKAQ